MLYRRLFGSKANFRIAIWSLCAFVLAYSIAGILIVVLQCHPIQSAWELTIQPTYRVNLPLGALIVGIVNVVADILTLVLPIHIIWGLHLDKRMRIQITGIFLLGSL